jgi:hypothetical protein
MGMREQQTVRKFMDSVSVGEPISFEQLALYPLSRKEPAPFQCITLDEAMAKGTFQVKEVDGGTVPLLLVVNGTSERVFLLDGEELVGARQNRILNLSLLVERSSELKVPVSCVEQGRWSFTGAKTMRPSNLSHPRLRHDKAGQVHDNLRARMSYESDQGQVWARVSEVLYQSDVASPTAALEDAFEKKRATLDGYAAALTCPTAAVGVAAVIAGRFVCADVFASAGMLASLWKKLVQSYALDATLAPAGDGKLPSAGQVMTAMRLPEDAAVETFESPGLGVSARIRTPLLTGSALVLEPAVVHLELFAAQGGQASQGSSRLSRPSRRAQL